MKFGVLVLLFAGALFAQPPAVGTGGGGGNAATATALAANPTDCTGNAFANAIAASGNLTCAVPKLDQNPQSATYTTVLADAGKMIYHPEADDNARTFTIDSNANVAYVIGTCITFINDRNTVTIEITSDTLVFAGAGTTGSRTLAVNGVATACKVTATRWYINGTGLS